MSPINETIATVTATSPSSTERSSPAPSPATSSDSIEDDWDEWDGSSPFWIHCLAGSLAGVVEHTAVYPLDTVRTHIQVCAACIRNPANLKKAAKAGSSENALPKLPEGMWQTIKYLTRHPEAVAALQPGAAAVQITAMQQLQGFGRLWRGVQTILIGCIPAHALYFSSYELVKAATTDPTSGHVTAYGSSLAGAAAVVSHDIILTPLDTMKQRMQLGHYEGVWEAASSILRQEGAKALLYRSFPITLATNVPYGMVMVSTHEFCKQSWHSPDTPAWQTVLMASSVAGCLASTVTTPLDRIKTALQTQQLQPAC
jgi:solute carrier family 25 iron transporter 28/37